MASDNPPSKWYTENEDDWGTVIDRDESTYITGNNSIIFDSTADDTNILYGPWFKVYDDATVFNDSIIAFLRYNTASTTGGGSVAFKIEFWNAARSSIVSTQDIVLQSDTTDWEIAGNLIAVPSTARWARAKLTPTATGLSGDEYIDSVAIQYAAGHAILEKGDAGTITLSGTLQSIGGWRKLDDPTYRYSSSSLTTYDTSTEYVTVHEPGVWSVDGKVFLDEFVSGDTYQAAIRVTSSRNGTLLTFYGPPVYAGFNTTTASNTLVLPATGVFKLAMANSNTFNQVELMVWRLNGAGTPDVLDAHLSLVKQP